MSEDKFMIEWRRADLAKLHEKIRTFRMENPDLVRHSIRIKLADIEDALKVLKPARDNWKDGTAERLMLQKQIDKLTMTATRLRRDLQGQKKDDVTPMMIERAKQYPIENLIEVPRSKFTQCLFHDDKHPSAKITNNNKLHCFSGCNKGYDAIDVYMQLHGVTFHEAVRRLQ